MQQIVNEIWRLRNVVLDSLPDSTCSPACAAVEIIYRDLPHDLIATSTDKIPMEEMACQEREVVGDILTGTVGVRGPFSRAGWIEDPI